MIFKYYRLNLMLRLQVKEHMSMQHKYLKLHSKHMRVLLLLPMGCYYSQRLIVIIHMMLVLIYIM